MKATWKNKQAEVPSHELLTRELSMIWREEKAKKDLLKAAHK